MSIKGDCQVDFANNPKTFGRSENNAYLCSKLTKPSMRQIFTLVILMAMSLKLNAQAPVATNFKATGNVNPISPCVFCADPTALEYNGRLYLYGTNDTQQYIKNNKTGSNGYGDIKSLVVFSTDDMVNWTFHGTIDVGKLCSSWGWRFAASWAPSITWRTTAEGKDEFFLYFANSGGSVGVIKASSPIGPWTSPLSKPLIDGDTPGVKPCNWIFDPGVVIDDNGTGYIAFGGGDPQSTGSFLYPGNSRIAKLKPSMIEIDGRAVNMPAPYLFEASELNMMNGRYVYTYNTSWTSNENNRSDWKQYEKRGNYSAPSSCSMCYMVSDTPLDPDSWEFRGEYVPNEGSFSDLGADWGNNHTHLQKYQGNYYLFYHGNVLEKLMKNAKAMDSNASGYRSLCVNEITVDETTQTISKVNMTKKGPAPLKPLNPYELQQAETMASCGGVSYEDFKNLKTITSKNTLGNDASENMYIKMASGSWTSLRNVDFGETGARSFLFRTKGTGTFEIRKASKSVPIATMEFSSTDWEDHVMELDPDVFKGTFQFLFLVFTQADKVQFDAWQFYETAPNGINAVPATATEPSARYDLNGRRLSNASTKGLVIEQYQDANGTTRTRKRF